MVKNCLFTPILEDIPGAEISKTKATHAARYQLKGITVYSYYYVIWVNWPFQLTKYP